MNHSALHRFLLLLQPLLLVSCRQCCRVVVLFFFFPFLFFVCHSIFTAPSQLNVCLVFSAEHRMQTLVSPAKQRCLSRSSPPPSSSLSPFSRHSHTQTRQNKGELSLNIKMPRSFIVARQSKFLYAFLFLFDGGYKVTKQIRFRFACPLKAIRFSIKWNSCELA